jgi:DNA anti-recombination protein RmuC
MSDGGTTEVEFAGVKFRGGKIFVIITALSTLGGGLYAGFEFYKDYINMRTKIEKYTAPDLSGFDKKLAVLEEQLNNVVKEVSSDLKVVKIEFESLQSKVESFKELEEGIKQSADDSRDYTKDIKRDLKAEMHHMSQQLDTVEKRGKEAFRQVRDSIDKNDTKVRTMVTVNSDRFDKRREQLRNDMDALELRMKDEMKELKKKVNDKIKKALENPLANMRK